MSSMAPPLPRMVPTFDAVDPVQATEEGPECRAPDGVVSFVEGDRARWLGENNIFVCDSGQLVAQRAEITPMVVVQDAGAGRGSTRRAAQVVLYTVAALLQKPVNEIEVGQLLEQGMALDHITVFYVNDADQALVEAIVKSLHLAMPWQAVISKKVPVMQGRVTVQVGW